MDETSTKGLISTDIETIIKSKRMGKTDYYDLQDQFNNAYYAVDDQMKVIYAETEELLRRLNILSNIIDKTDSPEAKANIYQFEQRFRDLSKQLIDSWEDMDIWE